MDETRTIIEAASASMSRAPTENDPIDRGMQYLASIQTETGSWKGDYDGPLFLLPGYVFARYVTRAPLTERERAGFVAYIARAQNADGGFGMHLEGPSMLFTTVLNYVALRLLGTPKDDPGAARARAWIHAQGGALAIPSWGKYWLSILRLYEWEGVNPTPPELWLLPDAFPLHPGRYWCHCRAVYLPVSYLYGRRWRCEDAPILEALRGEIYTAPYATLDWRAARDLVAATDRYVPRDALLDALNTVLRVFEPLVPASLRERALSFTLDQIRREQLNTGFIDIGPVNKAFDVVACYAADPEGEHTRRAIEKMPVYLFECERGLTMQSYNSSELWDTAFIALALADAGRLERFRTMARKAHRFIDETQVREDVPDRRRYYRDPSRGGWPFSTREHGWPIVDCTALGIMAALRLEPIAERPIARERLIEAVDLILYWQNADGGWPTYEKNRGNPLLERLNPSEIFGDIMVDYSYVELTSSAIQALAAMLERHGPSLGLLRTLRIKRAIARGVRYLRATQRSDGSWEGAWAICFTYGTWWGIWGLRAAGVPASDPAIRRAAEFLCGKQLPDGGWGESYKSCIERRYVHHPEGGQIVMTAWALLALLECDVPEAREAIARGVRFLIERQLPNGDWPQTGMTGVFNRTCMLNYRFYRNAFPLWALARAEQRGIALGA